LLTTLTCLSLKNNRFITADELVPLTNLKALRFHSYTNSAAPKILSRLEKLHLSNVQIEDDVLKTLTRLHDLTLIGVLVKVETIKSLPNLKTFATDLPVLLSQFGAGTRIYSDGSRYTGDWANNVRSGKGRWSSTAGIFYDGQWVLDQFNGKGHLIKPNGTTYRGHFRRDKKHGPGKITYSNHNSYEGRWLGGKKHGKGIATIGEQIFSQIWRNGKLLLDEQIDDADYNIFVNSPENFESVLWTKNLNPKKL